MLTILVTGGAGFIGGNFVRHWLSREAGRVVNYDALTYAGNRESLADVMSSPRHVFVAGDILDAEHLAVVFAEHSPDAVVHFAAESHVDRSIEGPWPFVATNVNGTYQLLEAARRHWRKLPAGRQAAFRFLHVSTDEVYGTLGASGFFTESTPYRPNSPYAASKAASDHLVRAYGETYGLPVLLSHCSNNYGPYQFPEKLIPHMIQRALAGHALPVYGDGLHVRDWIYVADHCEALSRMLAHGRPGATYNVGGGEERTNLELVGMLCGLLGEMAPQGEPYERLITFVADRPGHDRRYAIDASLARRELGWAPSQTLATGLRATVAWYLENQAWCERITSGAYRLERRGLAFSGENA